MTDNDQAAAILRLVEQTMDSASTLFQFGEGDQDMRQRLALDILEALTRVREHRTWFATASNRAYFVNPL